MAMLAVRQGTIVLVYDSRLGFGSGWNFYSKSRPCWVAKVDGPTVQVVPFTTQIRPGRFRFRAGTGGLRADCCLAPMLVELYGADLGPAVGWLDVRDVSAALEHMLVGPDQAAVRQILSEIDPPDLAA